MNTTAKLIIGILIGLLIAVGLFTQINGCNKNKTIATLTQQVNDCRHSPITITDSVYTDTIRETVWLKPKPADTVVYFVDDSVPAKFCEKFYSDTYKFTKGILAGKINYEIRTKDCDVSVRFPEIDLPIDVRTITKTVDTCLHPVIKSSWEW